MWQHLKFILNTMKKVKRELKKQNDATDTIIEETQIEETTLRLVNRKSLCFFQVKEPLWESTALKNILMWNLIYL